jgi:hypothetical protein
MFFMIDHFAVDLEGNTTTAPPIDMESQHLVPAGQGVLESTAILHAALRQSSNKSGPQGVGAASVGKMLPFD